MLTLSCISAQPVLAARWEHCLLKFCTVGTSYASPKCGPAVKDKHSITLSSVSESWKKTDVWTVSVFNVFGKFGSGSEWWQWKEALQEDTATKEHIGTWEINMKN